MFYDIRTSRPFAPSFVYRVRLDHSYVWSLRIVGDSLFKPKTIDNNIGSHEDFFPTLLAAVGDSDIKEQLLKGKEVNGRNYRVHIDGDNLLPYFKGEVKESPRKEFLYWSDDGQLLALRYEAWKLIFLEQRAHGLNVWEEPFVSLRLPKLFNLRSDPFERADKEAIDYGRWRLNHAFALVPAQQCVARWLASFKEFPPRQKPASFNLDSVMEKLEQSNGG